VSNRRSAQRPISKNVAAMAVLVVAVRPQAQEHHRHDHTALAALGGRLVVDDLGADTWPRLAVALQSGTISGAAVVHEFSDAALRLTGVRFGHLVVAPAERHVVEDLARQGWMSSDGVEDHLVFAPPGGPAAARAVSAEDFAEAIEGSAPQVTTVELRDVRLSDESLFGPFASTRLGGSAALLSLSGADVDDDRVGLRNPAALGLERVDHDERSIATHVQAQRVRYTAVGLSSQDAAVRWEGFADPEAASGLWAAREPETPFWVMVEFAAPSVDPPVWLPAGQIFEQQTLTGRQTLATATGVGTVVSPGRLTALLLPAYCLDPHLGSPMGDPMGATPFRVPIAPGPTQEQVWWQRTAARDNPR